MMKSASEKAVYRILFYRNLPTEFQPEINYYIYSQYLTYYALFFLSKVHIDILFVEILYTSVSCNNYHYRIIYIEKFLKIHKIQNVVLVYFQDQSIEMLDCCSWLHEKLIIAFRSNYIQNDSKGLVQSVDRSIKNLSKVYIYLPVKIYAEKIDMLFNAMDEASLIKNRKGI